jgi:hypothetical protein
MTLLLLLFLMRVVRVRVTRGGGHPRRALELSAALSADPRGSRRPSFLKRERVCLSFETIF